MIEGYDSGGKLKWWFGINGRGEILAKFIKKLSKLKIVRNGKRIQSTIVIKN
jgi:hypothetical protein